MRTVTEKLGNGLRVVARETPGSRVAALQVWIGAGGADEAPGEAGLAHVLEHMLFKGTAVRGVGEVVRDVEGAGGYVNAWTSHDETVFHVTVPGDGAERGLEVLADAIRNPAIDPVELERELAVILEEIRMGADDPSRAATEELFAGAFGRHPYGRPVIGTPRTVGAFDARAVRRFHGRWYTPRNAVLVAVGDFDARAMRAAAARAFGGWEARPVPRRPWRVAEPAQTRLRQRYRVLPVFEAKVALGFPIPGLLHPDVPALDLLAAILGQGASSRLENNVRRAGALASDIRAMAYTPVDAGLFGVFAMTAPERIADLVGAVAGETARLARSGVSPREIEKARSILMADAVYSEETADGIARKLGAFALHARDPEFERRYLAALAALDADDLVAAARRYLDPRALTVAAAVPDPAVAPAGRPAPWIAGGGEPVVRPGVLRRSVAAAVEGAAPRPGRGAPSARGPATGVIDLGNGDVLIVKPDPGSRIVAARVAFLGGVRHEPAARAGIVALLASCLTRGTASRSATEVSAEMDALAATISGFGGRNTFGIHGEFLARNWAEGFRLLAECLGAPALEGEEVERERQLQIDDIRAGRDELDQQAFELFQRALFGGHPYGRPILGTEETVSKLTAEALAAHLARTTGRGRMAIAVVGGADPDEALELVRRRLVPLRGNGGAAAGDPRPWRPQRRARQVGRSFDKEQSHIVLGFPGTTVAAADRHAVEVLTEILGSHGGRLFAGVRERRGLAYSVSATSVEGVEPGYVALYAATAPGQERRVVDAMLEEVRGLSARGPGREELARVKRHLVGARLISEQRAGARAATAALGYLYGLGPDSDASYPDGVRAVSRTDVVDAARRYLDPGRAVLSVVGPGGAGMRLL